MRLGIDLDGVVADFNRGWVHLYNRQFGTSLDPGEVDAWDGIPGLTHFEDMGDFWRWSSDLDGRTLFWHLEPYPGAVEALHDLDRDGHQIVIITTKPRFAVDDTRQWIAEHRLPVSEIHILEDKWTVDCDVYLDDGPHILPRLVARRPDRVVCRYVRPWNHPVAGVIDVNDFDQFCALVLRLESASTT